MEWGPTVLFVWTSGPSCRNYAVSFPLMTRTFCLAIGRLVCERVNVVTRAGTCALGSRGLCHVDLGNNGIIWLLCRRGRGLGLCVRDFVPIAGDSTLTFLGRKEIILLFRSTEFMLIWFISRVEGAKVSCQEGNISVTGHVVAFFVLSLTIVLSVPSKLNG